MLKFPRQTKVPRKVRDKKSWGSPGGGDEIAVCVVRLMRGEQRAEVTGAFGSESVQTPVPKAFGFGQSSRESKGPASLFQVP